MKKISSIKKEKLPFTQVVNQLLTDPGISAKAKGIYAFMYSKPEGWKFTIKSMSKQLKEGTSAIQSGLTELKKKGWLKYVKYMDGTGLYTININPYKISKNGKSKLGNSTQFNNKDSNNTINKKIINTPIIDKEKDESVFEVIKRKYSEMVVEVIIYYFKYYKEDQNYEHPYLKHNSLIEVAERLNNNIIEFSIDDEEFWKRIIEEYFNSFKGKTDYNIIHFSTGSTIELLSYRCM